MSNLVIIRGASGAGKTTYAKTHFPNHTLIEADQFFVRDGEYRYNKTRIKLAHAWCQSQVCKALADGKDVIVANTFTKRWELDPYLSMRNEYFSSTSLTIVHLTTQFENVHSVPKAVVDRMIANYEATEGEVMV